MGNLSIKVSSGNLESYEALLLQFPEPAPSTPVDMVELNFGDTSQVFPSAFGLMAAYIGRVRSRDKRPVVSRKFGANPLSAKLERAMDGFGFLPAVLDGKGPARPAPGMVALIAIDRNTEADLVANRVLDAVLAVAQPTRDMKETMFVLITEMVDNAVRHAAIESPAYLCGQLSAQKKKLELCLIDAGVGVRQSLLAGGSKEVQARLARGESPLKLALELGVSGQGERSSGFGLPLAAEALRLNRGMFRLTSGNETFFLSRDGVKHRSHAQWHGTVVNFLFNLANTGPLADVYKSLNAAVAAGEQFFEKGGDKAQGATVVLKGEGPYLGSRTAAAKARAAMRELVRGDARAVADADGVAAMSPGFAEECFGELLLELGEEQFRRMVYLKNPNESTRVLCEAVLGRRVRPADPNAPAPVPARRVAAAAEGGPAEEEGEEEGDHEVDRDLPPDPDAPSDSEAAEASLEADPETSDEGDEGEDENGE